MSAIWDLTHKYEIWLEVELQACAAFERAGQIPRGTSAKIRKKAKIDVARIAEIEKYKDKPLIVCCASGMRSSKACRELKGLGFTQLYNLTGGIDAWTQAGLPVKKGTRNK